MQRSISEGRGSTYACGHNHALSSPFLLHGRLYCGIECYRQVAREKLEEGQRKVKEDRRPHTAAERINPSYEVEKTQKQLFSQFKKEENFLCSRPASPDSFVPLFHMPGSKGASTSAVVGIAHRPTTSSSSTVLPSLPVQHRRHVPPAKSQQMDHNPIHYNRRMSRLPDAEEDKHTKKYSRTRCFEIV